MKETKCIAKHTSYQPSDSEWSCPKCGCNNSIAGDGEFIIEDYAGNAHEDCELLHNEDLISCSKCGYGTTGRGFVQSLLRKKDLVKCPCCKGKGLVSKKVFEKWLTGDNI